MVMVVCICHLQLLRKEHRGGLWSRPAQGIKCDPISKITNTNRTSGVTQVVEWWPSQKGLELNLQWALSFFLSLPLTFLFISNVLMFVYGFLCSTCENRKSAITV